MVAPARFLSFVARVGPDPAWEAEVRPFPPRSTPCSHRGVQFLRGRADGLDTGESALAALAMLKAEVPATDPALAACLAKVHKRFTSQGYKPDAATGTDIYEAGVVAMVLANLDAELRRTEINAVATYLMSKQKANGSWDYDVADRGDTSISQYAVLGLWEASNAGVDVPPTVLDRAARWYLVDAGRPAAAGTITATSLLTGPLCR